MTLKICVCRMQIVYKHVLCGRTIRQKARLEEQINETQIFIVHSTIKFILLWNSYISNRISNIYLVHGNTLNCLEGNVVAYFNKILLNFKKYIICTALQVLFRYSSL